MNKLGKLVIAAVLASGSLGSVGLLAQPALDMTSGEVKKIDAKTQRITLKHGDIENMGMPGMTMAFKVADPALLGNLKAGDKVKFHVESRENTMLITVIEVAR